MARKAFTAAPKPSQPTAEQIAAYEKGGPGTDRRIGMKEPKQRFSLDIPASLHRRFKAACAAGGRKMGHELLAMVENRTLELEQEIGMHPK